MDLEPEKRELEKTAQAAVPLVDKVKMFVGGMDKSPEREASLTTKA